MNPDFTTPIRRALQRVCTHDFLAPYRQAPARTGRAVMARVAGICRRLERGDNPNASTLAKEFGTSTKTIHRDLTFMRGELGIQMEYVADQFGFRLKPGQNATVEFLPATQGGNQCKGQNEK